MSQIDLVVRQFVDDYLNTKSFPSGIASTTKSHFIDVAEIGAEGDGIADDSDAFIESFKLAAKSRKTVIVPPGTYIIGKQVDIDYSNPILIGIGDAVLKRKDNSGPMTMLRMFGPHMRISGLTFDGNRLNNLDNDSGELLAYGDDAKLSDLIFKNGEYVSLQVFGSRASVKDSHFSSEITAKCQFGIYAGDKRATDLLVDNCTFIKYRLNAILTAPYTPDIGATRTRISHCRFEQNNDDGAGQIDLQQWGIIENSVFTHVKNGTSFAIEMQGGGIIKGNVMEGNGSNRSAVEIQGGGPYEVYGNVAQGYANGLIIQDVPRYEKIGYINEHDNHWNCPVKVRDLRA